MRVVRMGSAPATQDLFEDTRRCFPGTRIAYVYGTDRGWPVRLRPAPGGLAFPGLALGYPISDPPLRLRLAGDGNNNIGAGKPGGGELLMDYPAPTPGYHNLPEKTAEAMAADGLYRTGGVMRRDRQPRLLLLRRPDRRHAQLQRRERRSERS